MEFTQEQVQEVLNKHIIYLSETWIHCTCKRQFTSEAGWRQHFMAELVLLWTRDV